LPVFEEEQAISCICATIQSIDGSQVDLLGGAVTRRRSAGSGPLHAAQDWHGRQQPSSACAGEHLPA